MPVPAEANVCDVCHRQTASGLCVHRRRAHPNEYHQKELLKLRDKVPLKRRWDEEIARMALVEERLVISGNTANINQEVMKVLPGRTIEAIKGKRRPQT